MSMKAFQDVHSQKGCQELCEMGSNMYGRSSTTFYLNYFKYVLEQCVEVQRRMQWLAAAVP